MLGPGGRERAHPNRHLDQKAGRCDGCKTEDRSDHVWLGDLNIQLLERHHGENSEDHKGSPAQRGLGRHRRGWMIEQRSAQKGNDVPSGQYASGHYY